MSKETFKQFVRKNPNLASYVASGESSWQKFYEMFDMYGENSVVWDSYKLAKIGENHVTPVKQETTVKDLVQMIKGIDLETVRKGIDGVQKAIGLVQDLASSPSTPPKAYEPRPMYKYFED